MQAAISAGTVYVTIVFAAGFLLGTLRVLFIAPSLGEHWAVILEVPVMLMIAWLTSRWAVARFQVIARVTARLVMGGVAFWLLMVAEAGVGIGVFGRTLFEHVASYAETPKFLGLAAQVAFALFPAVQLIHSRLEDAS